MDLEEGLALMEAALADAEAELTTLLGGHRELTSARVWQGQVLVDWEPDELAGGCLLHPGLVRRLVALHGSIESGRDVLRLRAPGQVVAGLSPRHAELVARLGGTRRVALQADLRFTDGVYAGGEEAYTLIERGRPVVLVRIRALVRPRVAGPASPRT
jgi:hypothetical protein